MAALTTLNITEKNANNSLSVTVKVNVTKEGVFTTTLSKEDVDKIHSYGIKMFLQPVIYFGRAFPNWRARVIPAIAISGFLAFVSKNPICFSDGSVSS